MLEAKQLGPSKEVSLDRQRAIHLYLVLEDILTDLNTIDFKADSKAEIARTVKTAMDFANCVLRAEKDILEDE